MGTAMRVDALVKYFSTGDRRRRARKVHAVDGVSLTLEAGRTLAIVGESGSGKSTVARCILQLVDADEGSVLLGDVDLAALSPRALRTARRGIQMVFQDPADSLNPRFTCRRTLAGALRLAGVPRAQRGDRIVELVRQVGMSEADLDRFPHEFSGGQQQRIAIARALAFQPQVLVLDEPTASLDASIQGQIMRLLDDLQQRLGLAYLLISHDLANVRQVADEIAVMYLGRIVEIGDCRVVLDRPQHPYTVALLESIPIADPTRRLPANVVLGEIQSAIDLPPGCRFAPRCIRRTPECTVHEPDLTHTAAGSRAACYHPTNPTVRADVSEPTQGAHP